ncbi:MAG: T9SS type A sorting domain-containing protein [bacterium]|nr:T9SS type A sorting domain-containing protein [bacterium]
MKRQRWVGSIGLAGCLMVLFATAVVPADKILIGTKKPVSASGENKVTHQCLTPECGPMHTPSALQVERDKPWSLPKAALGENQQAVVRVLALRFNFQEETTDDPNTTGRGVMDFSRPLENPTDSAAYYNQVGHWIDPPPHNKEYFNAQMMALDRYWNQVSEGHVSLIWHNFPEVSDSAYTLPHPMSYYGRCDSVVIGLEDYFEDCIRLADTLHMLGDTNIDFSLYDAIILFHAGSDRQNDIGFPETCSDLFTGFIRFGDSIPVDGGARYVRTALLMPETSSQDNRATALNAVLAHEFGHQLGLVDIYSTTNFLSQVGDFSLMDNNGFSTGIDFGFETGQVFGAIPIYPDAWSRAYLGYVPVVDYRQGSDIRVVAAEVASNGTKIARVPISENEFYLIENRIQETDGLQTAALVDSATNVIQGPVNLARQFTGEYDFLIPGSGMLIYLVDEAVAGLDWDGDGLNNFDDNDLQINPERKFLTLIEADGLINFGGYYRSGFGKAEDMYRDDRNRSFTPNTNPPSIDNSGNNSRVFITGITRDTIRAPQAHDVTYLDSVMLFDLETENLASGFPVRVGKPVYGISPIVEDMNNDGSPEVIVASGRFLHVMTESGGNYLLDVADTCAACPRYRDSSFASVHPGREHIMPAYFIANSDITTQPVVGTFGADTMKMIAIGYQVSASGGKVVFLTQYDDAGNGLADFTGNTNDVTGVPIAMAFSNQFVVLTDSGRVYGFDNPVSPHSAFNVIDEQYHGLCLMGNRAVVMHGDSLVTRLTVLDTPSVTLELPRYYNWGPVVCDMDRDGQPEILAASPDGWIIYATIDTAGTDPVLRILEEGETGFGFSANPVAGDADLDGYADMIIGGRNAIYAFDRRAQLLTNFPVEINDRYPSDSVISAPIHGDLNHSGVPEMIFPTGIGNIYSFGLGKSYGFPLSAGELGVGSPVIFHSDTTAKLGYVGVDGWFYAWNISTDSTRNYWPMAGHDAQGSFALPVDQLDDPVTSPDKFAEKSFFNYPNPVTEGSTTFRYILGEAANRVEMTIYDLSGREIASMNGPAFQGTNEYGWQCSDVTPGVYRCRIVIDFAGETKTAFTDVAVIR